MTAAVLTSPADAAATAPLSVRRVAVASLAIFLATGGPSFSLSFRLVHTGGGATAWTNLYPFAFVAAIGIALLIGEIRGRRARELPWTVFAVGAYAGWALLSALWSVSPTVTPLAAAIDVGIAAFGCWLAMACSVEEQATSVLIASSVSVLLSIPVIMFWPQYGREPAIDGVGGGEWMGIFGNRNSLSAVAALGVIAAAGFYVVRRSPRRAVVSMVLGLVNLVVLWGTRGDTSRIALAACLGAAALVPGLWWLRRHRVPGYAVAGGAVVLLALAWELFFRNIERISTKLGMDPTLSRRTLIWRHVRTFIAEHPIRGYGYWAFWENPALTQETYRSVGAAYGSAHNSVLEVLLGLGVVGLICYLAVVLGAVVGICRWTWFTRSAASWWWFVMLVYLVAQNLTESFVNWHSYNWMLFVTAAVVPYTGFVGRGDGAGECRLELVTEPSSTADE